MWHFETVLSTVVLFLPAKKMYQAVKENSDNCVILIKCFHKAHSYFFLMKGPNVFEKNQWVPEKLVWKIWRPNQSISSELKGF